MTGQNGHAANAACGFVTKYGAEMINESYKHNFNQLLRAGYNGDLLLMECTDAITGKPVITVCIHTVDGDDMHNMQPIAKLFDGDPYEELRPPI